MRLEWRKHNTLFILNKDSHTTAPSTVHYELPKNDVKIGAGEELNTFFFFFNANTIILSKNSLLVIFGSFSIHSQCILLGRANEWPGSLVRELFCGRLSLTFLQPLHQQLEGWGTLSPWPVLRLWDPAQTSSNTIFSSAWLKAHQWERQERFNA